MTVLIDHNAKAAEYDHLADIIAKDLIPWKRDAPRFASDDSEMSFLDKQNILDPVKMFQRMKKRRNDPEYRERLDELALGRN